MSRDGSLTQMILNCLFERFANDLDYQSCLHLALTCRTFSCAWADFSMRDTPRRLARVYRGISLRHAITLLRSANIEPDHTLATRLIQIPPTITSSDSDEDCVAETIYFGLTATSDELDALCTAKMMRKSTANELLTVSRMHMHQPHLVPSTQIQALVPRGDYLINQWKLTMDSSSSSSSCHITSIQQILTLRKPVTWWTSTVKHGPRIISALRSLLHACNGSIERALSKMFGVDESVQLLQQALDGHVHALPYIVTAYVHVSNGKIIPRLLPELFDVNISLTAMSKCVDENRASVSAAVLLHAVANTMFAFRVRPRVASSAVFRCDSSRLPAVVSAHEAWLFSAANGLYVDETHPLAAAVLFGRSYNQFLHDQLRGRFVCALNYTRGRLNPPLSSISHSWSNEQDWQITRILRDDRRFNVISDIIEAEITLFQENRKRHVTTSTKSGHYIYPTTSLTTLLRLFPSTLFATKSRTYDGLVISCSRNDIIETRLPYERWRERYYTTTSLHQNNVNDISAQFPIILAIIRHVSYYNSYDIHWSASAMQLHDSGKPLRSFIIELLDRPTNFELVRVPRCYDCNRILYDKNSVQNGYGSQCRHRKKHAKRPRDSYINNYQ